MARFIISGLWKDKAVKDATKSIKGLEVTTFNMAKKVKAAYALAGLAAGYYAKKVLKDSIAGAMADEKAQKSLALTLKNVANATDNTVNSAEAQITSMGKLYGYSDDVLRPSLARLARSTHNVAIAQNALTLAMNISSATGKDVETVSTAIARAYSGNTGALGKLNLGIDANVLKSKDMNKILTVLRKNFKGFAEQEANTVAGKFRILKTAAKEAEETIGYALINAIDNLIAKAGGVDKLAKSFQNVAQNIADIVRSIVILNDTIAKSKLYQVADYLFVEPFAKGWQKIVNLSTLLARKERENLAIAKGKTAQVISARNAEYLAEKALKDLKKPESDDKRTELQRIADAMAAQAGFKIAEDLDSLNKIAAANRLEENRNYMFELINSKKTEVEVFAKSEAEKIAIAKKSIAELTSLLDVLGMKASTGFDLNFYAKLYGADQGNTKTPAPALGALPSGFDPNSGAAIFGSDNTTGGQAFMPGDAGYSGGGQQIVNNISITAGQTFSTTQEIQNYLLDAMLAAQRQGTLISLPNNGQ